MANKRQLMALALSGLIGTVQAGEKEELLKLRNTTTNLIKQLVKQGVITDKAANEMIKQAEVEAGQQVAEAKAAGVKEAVPADEVRVAYVPDFVKDEIRQQVRSELREEVVGDVMQKAKNEQWGLPNALPEWTRKFKLSGDLRLRSQHDNMAKDNVAYNEGGNGGAYPNVMNINASGGASRTNIDDIALNTQEDRHRFRQRLRIGVDADVADGLKAGIRLATANMSDPVSTNQTLGNTGSRYEFNIDRAFLKYDVLDNEKFNWLTVTGGRIKNPWATGGAEFTGGSELVWDTDLSFEGFAATARHRLGGGDKLAIAENVPTAFATIGAFPLQEFEFSNNDKWLFGGQVGVDWGFANQDSLKVNVAYFDYQNIQAVPNTIAPDAAIGNCVNNSRENTASRPEFMQGGNSLAGICNTPVANNANDREFGLFGLASDFNILNINASYDFASFSPTHVRVSADYAKNVGFDSQSVRKARILSANPDVEEQTDAWQVRLDVGWPRVDHPGNWSTFIAYKYVERDAVLDAFTDSDFRLGGTDAKGWVLGGNYGLLNGVWLTGRWLSADSISGAPYGVDMLQLDLNTRF